MNYYVDASAHESGDGTKEHPFRRIQEAADLAMPGDEILVLPGIYRENVNPVNAGCENARITYRSIKPLEAVITGADRVSNWIPVEGTVWRATIPNGIFDSYNPYTTLISGDWFNANLKAHTGEVYLNGKALYEVTDLDGVRYPKVFSRSWDPDFSVYTWYTEQDAGRNETILYANFQGRNPNEENVEINVRRNCFYPEKEGVGYITVSGFTITKAATQWAPPTALQEGMIGPHWSKGWIIEDCDISHSKCSGISLGKYLQPGNNNKWLHEKFKDGTQTERECILQASYEGWDREHVGSHIIRRNNIHDCGQTGIVGHMGGVFSVIEDNHIHHINNRQNLAGAEIAGIKMHAAIDVIIRRNHIHHCTRGIWLDWQAQGTRVTGNLLHDNTLPDDRLLQDRESALAAMGEDIFIEVSHGPTLIDNNVMLSDRAMKLATQGVAIVHNLIAGSFTAVGRGVNNGSSQYVSPRYTPYHEIHGTKVCGFMTILHGDMRFYNNVFIQRPIRPAMQRIHDENQSEWDDNNVIAGTCPYDGYPDFEEWARAFDGYCGFGCNASTDRYYMPLPVWTGGNVFLSGAKPCDREKNFATDHATLVSVGMREESGKWYLDTNVFEALQKLDLKDTMISTDILGKAFEPEERFENPDGSAIVFDTDFFGEHRRQSPMPGPFESAEELQRPMSSIIE